MSHKVNVEQAKHDLNAKQAKQKLYVEQTVSRVLTESVLTLPQAQKEIQAATGIRTDRSTLTRWILKGRSGIKLEAVRLGKHWITSSEALTRFISATTQASLDQ